MTGSLQRIWLLMYQEYICQRSPCVSVHVCFCKCQNKETVQWIFFFQYTASAPCRMSMLTTETSRREANTHKCTRTCSVSERSCRLRGSRLQRFRAGATTVHMHLPSGSEAVLYTCQPSSEPGYSPCTQTRPVLMKSLRDNTLPDERVSRGKHRKQNKTTNKFITY